MIHKVLIIPIIIVFLTIISIQQSFEHGVGGESLPVSLNNKNATLSVGIQPSIFNPNDNESYLAIGLTDSKTDASIEHVIFDVKLSKNGKQIFNEKFYDDLGNLNIKIISKESSTIKIDGDKDPSSEGWTRKLFSPITMEGPIIVSGGLYKFHIEIATINSGEKILAEKPIEGAISIGEKTDHPVIGLDEKKYNFGITSYYDNVENFTFDSKNSTINFEMPFDWSKQNINQINVVHHEIHIPKTFGDMLATKYDVSLNDIPLAESSVTIDDYSEDARIVHVVLNKKDLLEIADHTNESKMFFSITPSKNIKFPLQANTGNAQFRVGLSWDPPLIHPEQNIAFNIDFDELFSDKKPKPVTFDFVLKQHGEEIFRKKSTGQTNSPTWTNIENYVFSSNNLGPIIVSIEQIDNNEHASASFVSVVKPIDKPKQTFPIRLVSQINNNGIISSGNYFVDLTWFPTDLSPDEESEFVITIYDKQTLMPVRQAEYDFVILQNNNEIFQKHNIAPAGGSFVDFKFSESNVGSATLQIKNIDKTSQYVQLPILITPEFPFSVLMIFIIMFSLITIISCTNKKLTV